MTATPSNEAALHQRWRDAAYKGLFAPVSEGDPWLGKFRIRRKDGQAWTPVSIELESEIDPETGELADDEKIVAIIGFKGQTIKADPLKPMPRADGKEGWSSLWLWCVSNPVTDEDYFTAYETGQWPDAAPGGNFTPSDTFDGLIDQLKAMEANANKFEKVEDKQTADQAANLKDRAMEVHKRLEAMRVEEKRPHDDAARAVQAKFTPHLDAAKAVIEHLRRVLQPFFNKVNEQAQAAARAAAAEAGGAAMAAAIEAPRARVGGMSGRRTGTRKETIVTIVDYALAAAHVRDDPKVVEATKAAIVRRAKAGETINGVKVETSDKVV